jgi:hypothetical protein
MASHLDRWHDLWKDRGLRIVQVELGLATPRADFEAWAAEAAPKHTLLYDEQGALSRRFGVERYPTGVLVGRGGRVVWHGFPSQDPSRVEAAIVKALDAR